MLDDVVPLMSCPRCRAPLASEPQSLSCTDETCPFNASGSFPRVGRWAVVIDAEASVVDAKQLKRMTEAGLETAAPHPPMVERLPSWLQRIVKPRNHVASRQIGRLLDLLKGRRARVLVVGGGSVGNGTEELYSPAAAIEVIGLDLYGSDVDLLIADAHAIPLQDASMDAVVVQAVLEHVVSPSRVVSEIGRVLRPGGLVYAETPFLQQVHAGAHDFTRFTHSGHRRLFREFEEIDSGVVAGPGTALLWSMEHTVRAVFRSPTAGRVTRLLLGWLRLLDRVSAEPFAIDAASALFFLGRSSGTIVEPSELVTYYRGAQRS